VDALAGDYALQRHESNGRLQVEIVRLEAGGPDGLEGGDSIASTDWIEII